MVTKGIYILSIETSTNVCSVCIAKDGIIVSSRSNNDYKSHTRMIMVLVEECREEAKIELDDLKAICVSAGPGSYTGLRIGASTAKGLCLGLDIPLIGINSLEILAQGVPNDLDETSIVVPAIDARRAEVYAMLFDHKGNVLEETHSIILDESNILTTTYKSYKIHSIGNGASKINDYLPQSTVLHGDRADATLMAEISYQHYLKGHFSDIVSFSPYYHKNPNIILSKKNIL